MSLRNSLTALAILIVLVVVYRLNTKNETTVASASNKNASTQALTQTNNKNLQNSIEPILEDSSETAVSENSSSDESDSDTVANSNPSLNVNFEQLKQYIEKNDLCSLMQLRYSLADVASILSSSEKPSTVTESNLEMINELLSSNSVIFKGSNPTDGEHTAVRFFYALYLADLFYESGTQNQKYNTANDILLELSKAHPENGAYPFFRAFVLSKLDATNEQIKSTFLSAFNAQKFDTHTETVSKTLFELSLKSPSYFLAGSYTTQLMNIPDLLAPNTLLRTLIKNNDPAFNKPAEKFAEKISDISQLKKGSINLVHYNMLHIAIGLGLKNNIHSVTYPDKPRLPRAKVADIQKKINPEKEKHRAFFEELEKSCNSPNLNNHFKVIQNEYSKF